MSRLTHLTFRAMEIKRTLGTRCAAGFLRNRGCTLEAAMFILTGRVS